jgi:hypothetical protein
VKKLGKIEREWADRAKTIRAAVRLKYSLLADDELRDLLPEERIKFDKLVQQGKLPDKVDAKKALSA